ncbi:MAG: hypothetical protein ACE15B_03100 [Bryobacteraceae bacterium]
MNRALPDTVRVRLSPEEAGAVSMAQVVVRDIPIRELVEYMLGYTGKNHARVRELLLRGSLVSGASRFRWTGWEADGIALQDLLSTFPDPDPARPFAPRHCTRAVLRGSRGHAIPVDAAAGGFWKVLVDLAAGAPLRYLDYSYRERADWYRMELNRGAAIRLREAAELVSYSTLRKQILAGEFDSADLFAAREGEG